MTMILRILFIALIFWPSFSYGKNYSINCPTQIETTEKLSQTYEDWQTSNAPYKHFLNSVSMYVGKPEQLAMLKPEQDKTNNTVTWIFSANDAISISCSYQGTYIQLSRSLPKGTTKCTLWYKKNVQGDKGPIPDHLICYQP